MHVKWVVGCELEAVEVGCCKRIGVKCSEGFGSGHLYLAGEGARQGGFTKTPKANPSSLVGLMLRSQNDVTQNPKRQVFYLDGWTLSLAMCVCSLLAHITKYYSFLMS